MLLCLSLKNFISFQKYELGYRLKMLERTEWNDATLDDIFRIFINSIPIHITKSKSESIKSKFIGGNC